MATYRASSDLKKSILKRPVVVAESYRTRNSCSTHSVEMARSEEEDDFIVRE